MAKNVLYLEDEKYTEVAPTGIVKQMKERVPYDAIYIDVYRAGSWKIWWKEMGKIKAYCPWAALITED